MGLDAATIASMRSTVTSLLPNQCANQRTGATTPVWVYEDHREHHLPGASALVRMRRWALELPWDADVQRYDLLTVTGFGTYWVAEVVSPQSYSVNDVALCWQLTDASGAAISPISANATITVWRAGTQVGGTRRVRFMPSSPGNVTPSGERLPTTLYDGPTTPPYKLNDVIRLVAIDGFSGLPKPVAYRCMEPVFISEPPSYVSVELIGQAGAS